jgi:hypothetical protein
MWDPQRLTTLWAFTACYRDSFTFFRGYFSSNEFFDDKMIADFVNILFWHLSIKADENCETV